MYHVHLFLFLGTHVSEKIKTNLNSFTYIDQTQM